MTNKLIQKIDFFAVGQMPWIVRVYLFLFITLVVIVSLSGGSLPEQEKLFTFSSDLLKIVIGALLGVLSAAANQTWGRKESDNDKEESTLEQRKP